MTKQTKQTIIWAIVVIIFLTGGLFLLAKKNQGPGKLDTFAQCLNDSGIKFYGAFWCPHCKEQKAMFGRSQRLLPYVECSTPDGSDQLQICKDKGIAGYPTWELADGTRLKIESSSGVSLKTLSEKTSCPLPE